MTTSETRHSIYSVNIPEEYRSYVEDLSRMIMIQISANLLLSISSPDNYSFFSPQFLKTMLFIVIGVSVYWLVFRRVISFGPNSDKYENQQFYYGQGN